MYEPHSRITKHTLAQLDALGAKWKPYFECVEKLKICAFLTPQGLVVYLEPEHFSIVDDLAQAHRIQKRFNLWGVLPCPWANLTIRRKDTITEEL